MALEESQSLLLEMIVGRNKSFVSWLRPLLEKHYGAAGPEWSDENLYRHLNRVERGPNRMEADELTYQTHIGLRYELERRLLSGELAVKELREAWLELSADRLGLVPASDVDGCLQDIHWALGSFGHFPSYGVGAVIAGQLWEAIREQHPGIEAEIAAGQFGGLFELAAGARAFAGREDGRAAACGACDRPAAVGGAIPALSRAQVRLRILECSSDSAAKGNLGQFPATRRAPARSGRQGDRRFQDDRRGRSRDGLPVRRQGFLHAARHAAVAAARSAGQLRTLRGQPRPEAARIPGARAARIPGEPRRPIPRDRAGHLQRRAPRDTGGPHAVRALQPPAARRPVPVCAREWLHADRTGPPPRRHRRDAVPEPVPWRAAEGDAAKTPFR